MLRKHIAIVVFLSFIHGTASAAIIKSIDFESGTIGAAPSTSSTDPSKINNINFGDPLIAGDSSNQYLKFDPSNNDRTIRTQLYDQVQVGTYAYESSVRFSFDMFLGSASSNNSSAVLFFDNPTIQRFDFFSSGSIKAYNVDPSSRLSGSPVTYSNIYSNTFDVSSYDLTGWTNYIFDINYATELADVYINNNLAFSSSIFSQSTGTNSIRFSTGSLYGVDNLLLETNPGALPNPSAVPEVSSLYLFAFGLLGLFGAVQRKS